MIEFVFVFAIGLGIGYALGRRRRIVNFAWTPRPEYVRPATWTSTGEGVTVEKRP